MVGHLGFEVKIKGSGLIGAHIFAVEGCCWYCRYKGIIPLVLRLPAPGFLRVYGSCKDHGIQVASGIFISSDRPRDLDNYPHARVLPRRSNVQFALRSGIDRLISRLMQLKVFRIATIDD